MSPVIITFNRPTTAGGSDMCVRLSERAIISMLSSSEQENIGINTPLQNRSAVAGGERAGKTRGAVMKRIIKWCQIVSSAVASVVLITSIAGVARGQDNAKKLAEAASQSQKAD